jgi:hypothetical protein
MTEEKTNEWLSWKNVIMFILGMLYGMFSTYALNFNEIFR